MIPPEVVALVRAMDAALPNAWPDDLPIVGGIVGREITAGMIHGAVRAIEEEGQ